MAERDFLDFISSKVLVYDGGMGATLEQFDLTSEDYGGLPGKCHEALVLNRPDVIQGVHESMLEAGAQALKTDTFQGSRITLDEWGLGEHTLEINRRGAEIARKAAGDSRFVAGSIGPTGFLPASDDPTLGQITFRELRDCFTEQALGLVQGGVDVILIETAQDILEVKAAVFGAREAFKQAGRSVPIQTSVSLLPNGGKMLLGTDIGAVLTTLSALEVDAIGLNCSTGPEDMRDAIRYLGETSPLPVHCIPNAGLPLQGPDGETIFPEEPEPLATTLAEFVERYGVGIVGGCCGTTPDHIRALVERVGGREAGPRPPAGPPLVSSMMTATPLVQEPAPTLVGERVNSQGSRKAKELLLADDYDGLVTIAEDQVTGGAHVLDLCVALTERQDEDEQMRQVAKRVSLTQPAPILIDATEPEVIELALEQIPGRAIVNSINLEAGRDKADRVIPRARAHGAALIALTIDEVGMAKTAERKVEIAKRIRDIACGEHGLDPELLIFDALTFTLTTGDEEWRPSAVETIAGIRRIKEELPGVKTSLGVSNVSFGVSPTARAVLNSVFLHHCVEAGLDLALVNPNHLTPYSEIPDNERELTDDLVLNRREDALELFIGHFEQKGESEDVAGAADPTAEMEPEEALHWHILRRKKDGVEDWIDRSVEKIGAVPTLNNVLLPAMKEVGDKFGAGELILPFVLQSAEVMKRAVAQLENYLERMEGHTKGKVVIATVFGDVHDIGKSLVNTILTNNGYTVFDLGKQVPVDTIINAAVEHEADASGHSALLVSTSKQMPTCVQELHQRGHEFPVLIGGAAINRDFGRRILYPGGKDSDEVYEPGVFYCKDAFQGLDTMDALVDDEARAALVERMRSEAQQFREKPVVVDDGPSVDDSSVRSSARTDVEIPAPPVWGVREIEVDLGDVYPHLDRHVLFKLHWGGRGKKGEDWRRLVEGHDGEEGFAPRLERMWREQDYLRPRARLGYYPCNADGNELVIFDPEDHGREIERLHFPRQPRHDRICLADFYRPLESGERDVVALQGVTMGPEVTDLMAQLERDGEFAEQLYVHGIGVQAAEGSAEWLHAEARRQLGIDRDQGRRYSWGYPACPDQSEHEKVWRLLDLEQIGMTLSGGYAVMPEQSTGAIIAHHPQAVYFGMKSGFIPKDKAPDEVIAGTPRGGELPPEVDPGEGVVEAEGEQRAADEVPA
ncbi:MAG TPA: homocysteine S-methyltransferase family protein [Thermoleophilaceae bacterium]|nr:homocysteine S-methyltransferase family protein [Thermoleophilaceae bacterium]